MRTSAKGHFATFFVTRPWGRFGVTSSHREPNTASLHLDVTSPLFASILEPVGLARRSSGVGGC